MRQLKNWPGGRRIPPRPQDWQVTRFIAPPKSAQAIRVELIGDDHAIALGVRVTGYAPFLQICRRLVEAGFDSELLVEAYRGGTLALRCRSLLEAAELTVEDGRDGRPRFRKHRARVWTSPVKTVLDGRLPDEITPFYAALVAELVP